MKKQIINNDNIRSDHVILYKENGDPVLVEHDNAEIGHVMPIRFHCMPCDLKFTTVIKETPVRCPKCGTDSLVIVGGSQMRTYRVKDWSRVQELEPKK